MGYRKCIKENVRLIKNLERSFIKISRDVHFKNDIRAEIKKEINLTV